MAKRELMKISLQTVPNGYTLSVNGTDCMYFNEIDLMAGFMAHVGLGETANMEKGTILSTLFSAMMGETYANNVSTLKQRVGLLTSQYETTISRMDKAIEYVTEAEKTISGLLSRIDKIENAMKGTEQDHAQNKKVVEETKAKLADIEKRADKVMDSLANSATILKAMEEAGNAAKKGNKKGADGEGGAEPSKSKKGSGKANAGAEPAAAKTKRGRKKNDEAVLKELEKQAQENPNIK